MHLRLIRYLRPSEVLNLNSWNILLTVHTMHLATFKKMQLKVAFFKWRGSEKCGVFMVAHTRKTFSIQQNQKVGWTMDQAHWNMGRLCRKLTYFVLLCNFLHICVLAHCHYLLTHLHGLWVRDDLLCIILYLVKVNVFIFVYMVVFSHANMTVNSDWSSFVL